MTTPAAIVTALLDADRSDARAFIHSQGSISWPERLRLVTDVEDWHEMASPLGPDSRYFEAENGYVWCLVKPNTDSVKIGYYGTVLNRTLKKFNDQVRQGRALELERARKKRTE